MTATALENAQCLLAKAGAPEALLASGDLRGALAVFASEELNNLLLDLRLAAESKQMRALAFSLAKAVAANIAKKGVAIAPVNSFEHSFANFFKEHEERSHHSSAMFGSMLARFHGDCQQAAEACGIERPEAFHAEITAALDSELLNIAHPAPKHAAQSKSL